jgi:2-oxoglutarate ferredoxin oxidoreductase subunit alpha
MAFDITIKIGGEAGQGIQTVGSILSWVCQRAGLKVMAINDFESRIRGGHSFIQIRISDQPFHAPHHEINILVAMDQNTYTLHKDEVVSGGIILIGNEADIADDKLKHVPFEKLAQEAGGKITSNTVAAGVCLALLGAPSQLIDEVLTQRFTTKSKEILNMNLKAAQLGYQFAETAAFEGIFEGVSDKSPGILLEGSEAFALGALSADCRFGAFYPMSPATSIMGHLIEYVDQFPLVVEQAEDEIAAINMVVGAAFAGVRAMTATSGGGFSLMTEALGLAAITETPIVIINVQRPGPSTGLPTRTAQGDLLFVIHASQDEFPRFVFAPRNLYEAYATTARAFHLADKYQVPAIILADQFLCDSWSVIEGSLEIPAAVNLFHATDADLENPSTYRRFSLTKSGVSPRALPCRGRALVMVSSDEHSENGHMTEDRFERIKMVDKRNSKLKDMLNEMQAPQIYFGDSDILLVGWGSTQGAIQEAVDILRADGNDVGSLSFADLWPFPIQLASEALQKAQAFFMVEQNSGAQLGQLIRMQSGLHPAGAILKYDGRPFFPIEIVNGIQQHLR